MTFKVKVWQDFVFVPALFSNLVRPCDVAPASFEERKENLPNVFLINGDGEGWWVEEESGEGEGEEREN